MRTLLKSILFLLLASAFVFTCPAQETEKVERRQIPEKENVVLYTGVNRSREVFDILKELQPDMTSDGNNESWTEIKINVVQEGKNTTLTVKHNPEYYKGKSWEFQKLGMYNYFSQFPENQHKKRSLRLVKRLNFAVGCILKPARVGKDKRLLVILALSKKLRAIMFVPTPGSLIDSEGRVIMRVDGYADPEARVDL